MSANHKFVHLRVHTAYSLLEGAITLDSLVPTCKSLNMPAVAMTDSNNLFGALEFSQKCSQNGVQPIIGCQLDFDDSEFSAFEKFSEIVLIAKNGTGYANLLRLVSKYHIESDMEDGEITDERGRRVTLSSLSEFNEGLILLTGGVNGGVSRLIYKNKEEKAEELLIRLSKIFEDRLYIELQRHGLQQERAVEEKLIEFGYKHHLPLVATNDCFFMSKDMFESHDALICISEGAYLDQPEERRRMTPDHYFKTPEEMVKLFSDIPEAINNTLLIAKRCSLMAETRDPLLPAAPVRSHDVTDTAELTELATNGLMKRLDDMVLNKKELTNSTEDRKKTYFDRLEYEISIISKMQFSGYFLIVADFIQWAKSNGIPVGPGRGSGAGSLVAWALTITDLDPIRFGLLFERFLNPERVSMPDFDIDFCQERRDEVIEYVQSKYGKDRVAQIITFGTLQPRAALRDVGRVLQMPYTQVDGICKLIPNNPANPVSLDEAIDSEIELKKQIKENAEVERLINISRDLEGLYRHASTHAAGVVIGDRPLTDIIPLYRDPDSNIPVTQFAMKWAEASGLVKFDFLGLKTLTVLSATIDLLREKGVDLDLSSIPLDDELTFSLLGSGETTGLFQLESAGMRDVLRKMQPDSFGDIIAAVALFRPGPMENIPSYIKRKHGEEPPDYLHDQLKDILKETYGIIIYQEQVMQIAQELAGYTLGGADLLRRAMGKKIQSEMDDQREVFVAGAVERGVAQGKATEIFDLVSRFAGYGFNKSHAAAYALVAYQTAFLKAHYPTQFMAASMTLDINNTDKLGEFKQELDRLGIALLPPDINYSSSAFSVEETLVNSHTSLSVRYALAAIKNVGMGAMEGLVKQRILSGKLTTIEEFVKVLDPKILNKRMLENLIRAGALDCLSTNRRQLFENIETILKHASTFKDNHNSEQIGLFLDDLDSSRGLNLSDIADWNNLDRLKEEFSAIGFYLSAHPLDEYAAALDELGVKSISEIRSNKLVGNIKIAGIVTAVAERTSQRGNKYAFIRLSDNTGVFEATVFNDLLSAHKNNFMPGSAIVINAVVVMEGQTFRMTIQSVKDLHKLLENRASKVTILVEQESSICDLCGALSELGPGAAEIVLASHLDQSTRIEMSLPGKYKVKPGFGAAIEALPGIISVEN